MKTTEKATKKFIGERAYNIVKNQSINLELLKNSLVTATNARNIFNSLDDEQINELVYRICNTENLVKVVESSQEEIKELFSKVGYDTVFFDDYSKIEECKKYYTENETICTYNSLKNRINNFHMLVAVKNNIDDIKRAEVPSREDEYGTSILNIQIAKNGSQISIKNRYNNTVKGCDATLNNNLNNLCHGLHEKVLGYYNFASNNFKQLNFKNVVNIGGVYLYYKYEYNNIYYGDFVLDFENGVQFQDKSRYLINIEKTYRSRYNPIIFDFKEKKAFSLGVEKNIDMYAYTRLLQDKIINHENLQVKTIVKDVKKELLQANKKAMKYLHDYFNFDFMQNYNIDMVVGGFTANSIRKHIKQDKAIILINDNYNKFHIAILRGSNFEVHENSYNTHHWSDYKFEIDIFCRKSDFEIARKNNKIAYIIYQKEELKCIKETKEKKYKPTLQDRLRIFKSDNRQTKVKNFDFIPSYNILIDKINKMNLLISEIYSTCDIEKIDKLQDLMNYEFKTIVYNSKKYKSNIKDNSFYSVEEALKNINHLSNLVDKYTNIIMEV